MYQIIEDIVEDKKYIKFISLVLWSLYEIFEEGGNQEDLEEEEVLDSVKDLFI